MDQQFGKDIIKRECNFSLKKSVFEELLIQENFNKFNIIILFL